MRQKRIWLGTETMNHKYHHSEDPKFGQAFQIMAIQFESIDGDYTDWIENGEIQFESKISISSSDYLFRMRKMGETNLEWMKMKNKISDELCGDINRLIDMCTNLNDVTRVKDVVAYKIHYLGDKKGVYQIL